jgi:tetratricopeptide (TPR) repeat protein
MDAMTTPAASSNPMGDRPAGSPLRQLWQVPVFFVGVVALVTACLIRPYVGPDPVRELHHDLAEARHLLHRHNGDPEAVLRHAQNAVDNLMHDQTRGAEAFYLLGSAHIRVAEAAGETGLTEHWREARKCLEEAERRGLSGEDASRLHYRLAKIGFYTNDDPQHVIALLKANKDQADDLAEAYTLLSQAYLRLNPPNLKEALKANQELRQRVPQIGEDILGPAKLAGAKLLLRMGQPEEARKTLEKINDQSPPAVLIERHMLLAGLYQEDHKWAEAAELWRAVLNEKRIPPVEPGGVLYNLGLCCRHLDQLDKATEAWTECLHRGHGEEVEAAALALAEQRLREAHPDKAVEMLARAVAKVRKASDWKNVLMDLPRVQDLFERAIETYSQAKRHDLAVQAAELYERVAIPPRAQVLRAERATAWARSRQEQAKKAGSAEARKKEETTADELLRQAAEAHAEAAKYTPKPADKDEHIWLSAVCSFDGHDYKRAAEKLRRILEEKKDEDADRQSEGWFLLGETCRNLNDPGAARKAYMKCVEFPARFTCRARYQLAMLDIEAGEIDNATRELEQNLQLDYGEPDREAQEKSKLALCSLLYQSATNAKLPQNYRRVVVLLEGAIDHYPATAEAVRARYQLADSYRQLAAQRTVTHFMSERLSPEAQDHYVEENRRALTRAAEEFGKLEEMLQNADQGSLLSLKQRDEVPFIVAQCRFNLGEYDKALQKYDELARKWGNRPQGLWALGGTVQCFGSMGDFDQLRQRADHIRTLLSNTEGLSEVDRQQWLDWLNQVSKVPPPAGRDRNKGGDQPRILNERDTTPLNLERP